MQVRTAITAAVSTAATVLLATALGSSAEAQTASTPAVTTVARGQISPAAWRTNTGLYVTTRANQQVTAPDLLQRRSPQTGKLEGPTIDLGSTVRDITETGSKLWVSTDTHSSKGGLSASALEVFNATTLESVSNTNLPVDANGSLDLAIAGGNIWVADGANLIGVSQSTGAITQTIAASPSGGPKALFETIASPQHGQTLVDALTPLNGTPRLQVRDPSTGAVKSQSAPLPGISVSHLSAYQNGVWATVITGNDGYIQRFSLPALAPVTKPSDRTTNTLNATVYTNTLLVTNTGADDAAANYCANPTTGAKQATLTHASSPGELLTSGPYSYFFEPNIAGTTHRIQAAPIPTDCQP